MSHYQQVLNSGDVVLFGDDGTTSYIPVGSRRHDEYIASGAQALPADPSPIVFSRTSEVSGKVRTADATATEVYRATLAPLTGYAAVLVLIGVDAANGACRIIRASVAAKRLAGGAVLIGAPVVLASHADVAATTWAVAASASGNDFVVTVQGAAGRTVDWSLTGTVTSFAPSGS